MREPATDFDPVYEVRQLLPLNGDVVLRAVGDAAEQELQALEPGQLVRLLSAGSTPRAMRDRSVSDKP